VNTFALRIWDDECDKVTFYTVHQDGHVLCETDKFFEKYSKLIRFKTNTERLLQLILEVIGNTYGAHTNFFNRFEDQANALPHKGSIEEIKFEHDFPLRLYCYRVTDSIVVLFNGGEKTAQTVQNSSNLNLKFIEAKSYVKLIQTALNTGEIKVNNRILVYPNNPLEEIILP
jgi:hypothetical protein